MATERQVFRCQNRDCGCEIVVTKPPVETRNNPRCFCGAEMKKRYSPPVFRTLNPDDELVSRFEAERLASLRPLLADSRDAQKYLRLFDEFIRECEFGWALATLCDFLFETPTLVNRGVVEQIEQLHSLMNVKDMPLEKLRALARPK